MRVLTINTGSSSLKAALYRVEHGEQAEHTASYANLGQPAEFAAALQRALTELPLSPPPDAVGHRLVAAGAGWAAPRRVDEALLAELEALVPFSPDHLPQALAAIRSTRAGFPGVSQIACSDSTFHRTLPEVARTLALPRALAEHGLRRYGFHGLSCEYVLEALRAIDPAAALGRVIIAHLGNGSSLTAVHHGESRDTTMGFTPLGGLPMSTRSGDLDPGALIYLLRERGLSPEALNRMLNQESGLRGVSGSSGDMQALLANPAPEAAAAVALFVYQTRKFLGALTAALGGLDTLVFTGGIGENSEPIRRRILAGMEWCGIFDGRGPLSLEPTLRFARVTVRVIPTDEDRMVARHTAQALAAAS